MQYDEAKRKVFAIMQRFKQERYLPMVAPADLTPSEATVIIAIYFAGLHGMDAIQPHFIAKRLHLTPSALSQTLKVLEEKGYLVRARMSGDSRAVSLELTDRGASMAEKAARIREDHLDELIAYVGEEDMGHLMETLEKILDFYKQQEGEGKVQKMQHKCCAPPGDSASPPNPHDTTDFDE